VVFLHDAPATVMTRVTTTGAGGTAAIERERNNDVLVRARAPGGGFLLLADTFYPGWTATVDGKPAPIYRANISVRAVPLSPGSHRVRFHYAPASLYRGAIISLSALGGLLIALVAALVWRWRSRHAVLTVN
jgi:uncharacterized membrane protein YfhO